ncbi:retinol-binding protein 1 isoform X1 [Harpia harpyja]|uniref:retinol-binding protein 1 isoform X1 n=1 Tax=Harpia harpyja TaxID=202280 RepID=UPI0022B087D3|nr:retinol-binding protein 1 isoform X1 [Harpia harpyja]
MPADFNGYWKMVSNDNFEEYLKALDVNVAVRKIANLLKPDKEILQNGDHMIIKTLSTFRNYIMEFDVGKEFEEDLAGVDDRKCMTSKASSPPRGAPFSITPQEQRIYNPKYVQYWWLEFLRKVKLRQDSFLFISLY